MKESKRKFKPGQTAYLLSGHEVHVHGYVEGGEDVIISYVMEDLCERCSDYILSDSVIFFVEESNLYHDVPIKKLDKGVKVLRELIFHLEREVEDKKSYLREMKSEIKELDERVKKYDALKNVFDFIDGKMTHYVVSDYSGVNVIDSLDRYGGGRFEEKLMTLFGRSDGNLQWRLSRYSDGSGSWVDIFPCCSYEEAVRVAKDWISEKIKKEVLSQSLLKSARFFSVDVPKEKIEELIEKESKFIGNTIKSAEDKIRIERSKIEEIKKMANCQDVINEE